MSPNEVPRSADDLEETENADPSWLPEEGVMAPLEADAADWVDQERTLPDDAADDAPRT